MNFRRISISIFCYIIFVFSAYSQDDFEGKIIYRVKVTGTGANITSGMIPDTFTFFISAENLRMTSAGGAFPYLEDVIYQPGAKRSYILLHTEKSALECSSTTADSFRGKPTGKNKKVCGKKCTEYKHSTKSGNTHKDITYFVWENPSLSFPPDNEANCFGLFQSNGMDGWPLKVVIQTFKEGFHTKIVIEAVKIQKDSFTESFFAIPDGYVIEIYESDFFEY